jgi:hypothetical protein
MGGVDGEDVEKEGRSGKGRGRGVEGKGRDGKGRGREEVLSHLPVVFGCFFLSPFF